MAYDFDSDTGDYSSVSTTLGFPPGETNKSFNVVIYYATGAACGGGGGRGVASRGKEH